MVQSLRSQFPGDAQQQSGQDDLALPAFSLLSADPAVRQPPGLVRVNDSLRAHAETIAARGEPNRKQD